ncbi:hypothetical protein HMPREF2660_05330 [Weeksella sp. HMSC059D05]|uniref:Surface antigen (D15) n=1 Tax=Weeksella virosa (strain ATCC 43766 / DSM 16922 / JCM 21250 / CCUG 30538 / CDC 9751 / IAM 14551 / NBRC 16016 / NCTC 11634 / CL345/78) TaxID=865938 RepID=F0P035_WEEVC|nr:BamA/TamA family outer membrane protein [Weeksella virosa]ADX67382.1 surface antigen (D15) [Weeksella virosa DSM 16922]OFM81780.1 hypothetical protein HMPREF2660_05330 [Weeksella sp. HMSC059D05]SUP53673.1 Outer membrane protein/protective antigen OMA87 [Weeksella virosa]VEH62877.1 Outer membrane protein/protective antigen OMA87 [Weeksella virosa]
MQKNITNISLLFSAIIFFWSCNATKKVPEGEYLLTKNTFEFIDKEQKKNLSGELNNYVKQKPNAKVLGFSIPLAVYNMSDPKLDTVFEIYYSYPESRQNRETLDSLFRSHHLDEYVGKSKWLDRLFFTKGQPPVILDTAQMGFSERNLEVHLKDKGFFDSDVTAIAKTDSTNKKAEIVYKIKLNSPSYIETYSYNIQDTLINRYVNQSAENSLLFAGDQYNYENFEKERNRIVDYLKNRGFYDFNASGEDIYFEADTTKSNKRLDVTMFIDRYIVDSTLLVHDTLQQKQYNQYTFNKIRIFPDSETAVTPDQFNPDDFPYQRNYKGYELYYREKPRYRAKYFTDGMVMEQDALYRLRSETQSKRNILKKENMTFRGFIPEKVDTTLNYYITYSPKKTYDMNLFFEGYWARYLNFAISPGVTLTARNLFRGGENLETTFKGTLGNVNNDFAAKKEGFFNAYELSLESKIRFPYLFLPFNVEKFLPKRFSSESVIRIGSSTQRNVGLDRNNYTFGLDFDISYREFQHKVSLFNIEYVRNNRKERYYDIYSRDREIFDQTANDYFLYDPTLQTDYENDLITRDQLSAVIDADQGFRTWMDTQMAENFVLFQNMLYRKASISQDALINSFIYQFTYNEENVPRISNRNPWFINARIELAGNLLGLLDKSFGFIKDTDELGEEVGTIFSIPYSQFVKVDVDARKKWNFDKTLTIATRAMFGFAQPYGNSNFIPFIRSYSAGGSNDVRGWAPLTLGPSDQPRVPNSKNQSLSFESMKILLNAEVRKRFFGNVEGAYFIDAGNIWGTSKDRPQTMFHFDKFINQFGIGTGVGLRYHIGTFAIIRLDAAFKLHDPSYPKGERWRFVDFKDNKPRLHFGINYPF